MSVEHVDVLIVGAGLSGIGAGYHLPVDCPDKTYEIVEARDRIGGTWDLFSYPGVRSDSDMYTLGYAFRPWAEAKAIVDGSSILSYVRQTARDYGIDQNNRGGGTKRLTGDSASHLRLSFHVRRLLPLRRGLHPRFRGSAAVRRV
jgi:monooxygenase